MNTLMISAMPTLLSFLVKESAILLAAWLICLCLRRTSAAVRHLVWIAALSGILLLPILSMSLPHWNVALGHAAPIPVMAPVQAAVVLSGTSVPEAENKASSQTATLSQQTADEGKASEAPAISIQPKLNIRYSIASYFLSHVFASGLLIWLIGFIMVLLQFFVGLRHIGMIRRRSMPLCDLPLAVAEEARQVFRLDYVEFLQAKTQRDVAVPITWGLLRPTVLVPAQSASWSEDCLRAALLHELAHVQRRDWPTQTVARFICALYWWHPLVWLAAKQAREESERACDDLVLGTGTKAADYALRLVEVVRSMPASAPTRTVAVAMAQPSEVEGRVKAVLAKGKDRSHLSPRRLTLTVMMLCFLLTPLSTLRPVLSAADGQTNDDQANAVSVPVTTGYKETLPNGFTIDVLGVTRVTPVENGKGMFSDAFWGPDGTLLPSPLAKTGRYQKRFGWESTPTHPLFALDLRFIHPGPAVPISNLSTYCQVTSADGHVGLLGGQPFWRFNTRKWTDSDILPITSSPSTHTCSLRLGIATGQWQTVATLPVRLTPQTGWVTIRLGDKPEIDYQTQSPSRIERTDTFLGTSGRLGNVARQAVIVDDSGREIQLQEGSGAGGTLMDSLTCRNGSLSMNYPRTPLPHVKAILLQTRSYQMAEFRNIQLQGTAAVSDSLSRPRLAIDNSKVSTPWGWVVLPTATTVTPFTYEYRSRGKLLEALRAQGGYDKPTQTLRQVRLTEYQNGLVCQTIRSDAAELLGSTWTFYNVDTDGFGPHGEIESQSHSATLVFNSLVAPRPAPSEVLSAVSTTPNFKGHPMIVVDPGHGGLDTGAVGAGGMTEKALNLEIAQQLRAELERRGAIVLLTRDGDTFVPIQGRPQFAAQHHADYFVSLHCDVWANRSDQVPQNLQGTGTVVFFHEHDPKQRRLAQSIGVGIGQATALPPSKVVSDATRFVEGFGVLRGAQMPAALIEYGYMNSPQSLSRLLDPRQQQRLTEGIAAGLVAVQVRD